MKSDTLRLNRRQVRRAPLVFVILWMAFSWLGGSSLMAQEFTISAPESLSRTVGESAAFSVEVTGSGVFQYLWRKDGQIMSGATAARLLIPSVAFSDAGLYTVEVVDGEGKSKVSQPAGLAVNSRKGGGLDLSYLNASVDHEVNALAVQPDGKVVIAGDFTRVNGQGYARVARINRDGTLDGVFRPSVNGPVHAVAVQADGHVVLGGEFSQVNGETRRFIARLHRITGQNEAGWLRTNAANGPVYSICQSPNGLLVGGAFTQFNNVQKTGLVRLGADGSLDSVFNPNLSFNGVVRAVALDSSNRILVGGGFTEVAARAQKYLVRLLADGEWDPSFALGADGLNGEVWSVARDFVDGVSTGKWLVAGQFTRVQSAPRGGVARLNEDGSLDTGFGAGLSGANALVRALTVFQDGKVVLGGDFTRLNGIDVAFIGMLDQRGVVDPNFAAAAFNSQVRALAGLSEGRVFVGGAFTKLKGDPVGSWVCLDTAGKLVWKPGGNVDLLGGFPLLGPVVSDGQGRLLLYGNFRNVNGSGRHFLVRLLPDGSLDTSFARGGGPDHWVGDLKIGPDGKIYICGDFKRYGGVVRPYIARLDADGNLDPTFGGDSFSFIPDLWVNRMFLLPNGKVFIFGAFAYVGGVRRSNCAVLNADGAVDLSIDFGSGFPEWRWVGDVELDAQGRVLIGGGFSSFNGDTKASNFVRFKQDGSVDETFSFYGRPTPEIFEIERDPVGRIVFTGNFTSILGKPRTRIARLYQEGGVDESFAPSGLTRPPEFLAVDSRRRVLISGIQMENSEAPGFKNVMRLNEDGSLDRGFGGGGFEFDVLGNAGCLSEDSEGRVLLGGTFETINGVPRNRIARLSENGSVDLSFGGTTSPHSAVVNAVAMDAQGRCVVGGEFWRVKPATGVSSDRGCLARIRQDGVLEGFAPWLNGRVNAVEIQQDGKMLVGGRFTGDRAYLIRLLESGYTDEGYGRGDTALNGEVHALAVQPDGKVLVGGAFSQFGGTSCGGVMRTLEDGQMDQGFSAGLSGANGKVLAVRLQADGKILIGGDFTQVHGVACAGLARLEADGRVDASFQSGLPVESTVVRALALDSDGRILVGGSFRSVPGVSPAGVARLNRNGQMDQSFARGLPGAEGTVNSVAVASDGRIFVGGEFQKIHGVARGRFARLHSNGTLDASFGQGMLGATDDVNAVAVDATGGAVYAGGEFRMFNGEFRNCFVRIYDSGWDADLKQLSLSAGVLNPVFVPGWPRYRVSDLSPEVGAVRAQVVTAVEESRAQARINGGAFSGVDGSGRSQNLVFGDGENLVDVQVTSGNGKVTRTYSVGMNSRQPVPQVVLFGREVTRNGLADCGSGPQGGTLDREILIRNRGTAALVLGAVGKDGQDVGQILIGQPSKAVLSPGEQTVIPLRMNVGRLGIHEVQLQITTNVLAEGEQFGFKVRWAGVDSEAPETTLTQRPVGVQRRNSVVMHFEGSDNVGVAFFEGRHNGGSWARVTSPHRIDGLVDGSHQFEVRAVDFQGNRDATPASTAWALQSYVAVKGSRVPGAGKDPRIPEDAVWEVFGVPAMNGNGSLAFVGTWSSRSKVRESGVFSVREGEEAVLRLKSGDRAEGASGTVFKSFLDPLLAEDDSVTVLANLASAVRGQRLGAAVDRGLWRIGAEGGAKLLAREGDLAGDEKMRWASITSVVASRGVVAFTGTLVRGVRGASTANDTALWVYDVRTGAMRTALREGDSALGSQIAIIAGFAGRGRESGHGRVVMDDVSDAWKLSLRISLKNGRQALAAVTSAGGVEILPLVSGEGTGRAAEVWRSFGLPVQSSTSGFVFGAEVRRSAQNPILGALVRSGASLNTTGSSFIHTTGESVPGLNGGTFFRFSEPVSASEDSLAFCATLNTNPFLGFVRGADQIVCWKRSGQGTAVVARTGAIAPWNEGVFLWKSFDGLALGHSQDGLILVGTAVPAGVRNGKPIKALWAGNTEGRLVRLLRVGDQRIVGARIVTTTGFDVLTQVAGSPVQCRSFNEQGQVIVREFYSDGGQALRVVRYRD